MSRVVTVVLKHDLGVAEASRRLREGACKLRSSLSGGLAFSFEERWEADQRLTFAAKGLGQKITGVIDVFPQHVRIEANLPGVLAALAEIITGSLEKQGTLLLEKK
jgi:hypothetical protein